MNKVSLLHLPRWPFCSLKLIATAVLTLGSAAIPLHAQPDMNSRNQGIWRLKFGATTTQLNDANWLAADADGDGVKNGAELAAGTNPFSPSTTIRVTSIAKNASNVDLTFPTVKGKRYQAQVSTSLTSPNWATQTTGSPAIVVGDDTAKTITIPYVANNFYRILVDDIDSDGDGISDWAEYATNLNPNAVQTVAGLDDVSFVDGQLQISSNEVTIKAVAPFASEDGPVAGSFLVTRKQKLVPITVSYNTSGTATPGVDYSSLPGSVTFGSGPSSPDSLAISVNPLPNSPNTEGSESVTATLTPPAGAEPPFIVGANDKATVIINDTTQAQGTGLTARYYDTVGLPKTYTFTRDANLTTGTAIITHSGAPVLQVGDAVTLRFTSGTLATTPFSVVNDYTIKEVTSGSFQVGVATGNSLPSNQSSSANCELIFPSYSPAALIQRTDPTVDNDWAYGTPNAVGIVVGTTQTNQPDNLSSVWEGYLNITTAGNYRFQLDADDKAHILIDLNRDGDFLDAGEEVVEHGWDGAATPETVGVFKQSANVALALTATPAERYKIRVEHVETTGEARCRVQWLVPGTTSYVNIPQANVYSHASTMSYSYSRSGTSPNYTGTIVVTLSGHGYTTAAGNNQVNLAFSSGNLFTPGLGNFHGAYTVTASTASTFTVTLSGANLPSSGTGSGLVTARPVSTTTGWFNQIYANTTFTAPPGRVGIDNAGATNANNGIWGTGTPDATLINPDTFSARWTGQVQPQFTETYTFVVHADDGASLRVNGQVQQMRAVPATTSGLGTYDYNATTGEAVVNYVNGLVKPGTYTVGEPIRVDPTSGNLIHGTGSTYTFDGTTGYLTVDYSNLANITPGGFTPGETIELDPTSGSLSTLANLPYTIVDEPSSTTFRVQLDVGLFDSGSGTINIADTRNTVVTKTFATGATYTYNTSTGATVVNYSGVTGIAPGTFLNGTQIELDPTAGTLGSLTTDSYTISNATATTFQVTCPAGLGTQSTAATINIASSELVPESLTTAFAVSFGTGKYSTGTGNMSAEILNQPLKEWASMGNERYVRIPMVGGTRYDIQLDYWENSGYARCRLFWYSPSQPKQIIPSERLYPESGNPAPAALVSSTDYSGLEGGSVSIPVAGSNGSSVTVSGNPPWLTYSNGVLSGTPPAGAAGDYQILITVTNSAGTSTSVLNLHVENAGGSVVREYWNGVYGSLADIPTHTDPAGTTNLTSLQSTNAGDNFGARIRGYITAPVTGNYYFWVAASNAAELWISNDDEPINAFKRAWVDTGSGTALNWGAETNQKSPWLALEQGKKYYFEVLQKALTGNDNVAVGWSKPGEGTATPSEVVPGYTLTTYTPPAAGSTAGTLYVATMLAQNGAVTNGSGTATLRISDDETVAYINFDLAGFENPPYKGLTGPITDWHIHSDPYLTHGSFIIYDGVEPPPGDGPQPDGTHKWTIAAAGTLGADEIRELIKQGKAYINLHTAAYPNGEIRGNFTLAAGSRTFTPPPAPPSWTDDSGTDTGAARFLAQATFGENIADITALKALSATSSSGQYPPSRYETWIDDQFTKSTNLLLPEVLRTENASAQGGAWDENLMINAWWWRAVAGDDQLRQRIAFAMSQIHVVSGQGPLDNEARALAYFYDTLANNAFGNFRTLLEDTTLAPGMGRYLDMLRNDKPDQTIGRIPNENYAREIEQLFSIGLFRMWPDGSLMLTSKDTPIDTYTQREIIGFAHAFTGWDYGYDGAYRTSLGAAANWTRPMREVPARHYTGPKRILNNEVLPGLGGLGSEAIDPNATHNSNLYNDATYQGLPAQELDATHDQLFNHPNVGPFICRQLIQRLVTSHPSRGYLYRVVQKFNDNGAGVRGDMKAVIKAILLDYEARHPELITQPAYGKQREPLLRVTAAARAFRTTPWTGTYSQSGSRTITVNTTTPHRLASGATNVFLDFTSGSPAPWAGTYGASVTNANTFSVQAQGWRTGSYNIPANSSVCTITMSGHWLETGHQVYVDFSAVSGGTLPADGIYTVASSGTTNTASSSTFTITVAPQSTTRSGTNGSVAIPWFPPGSFTTSASGLPAPNDRRVTMDTNVNHELEVGDQVQLNFYFGSNPQPVDAVVTVESVVDRNTWTFLASGSGTGLSPNQGNNSVYQFPLKSLPLTRSGSLGNRPSTFAINNTTTDLEQSPLYSPTVFNFFLPDYKYPGSLAAQGITTPEFMITAETTAIRQANYLYNGIFGSGSTNGVSSFNSGNNALMMDFVPWMTTPTSANLGLGAPPNAALPWTHNQNLLDTVNNPPRGLIDQLSTILAAGQISTQAKTLIKNFIATPIASIGTGSVTVVNTAVPHQLNTGDSVVISGVIGGTFNGTASGLNSNSTARTITVVDSDTFTINSYPCTVAPTSVASAHVSVVAYNNLQTPTTASPSATQMRDRLRAIIHLILTSPDFTIQR